MAIKKSNYEYSRGKKTCAGDTPIFRGYIFLEALGAWTQRRALAEVDPEDEDTPRMVHLENGSEILGRQRSLGGKVREEAEPLTNDSRPMPRADSPGR